MGATNDGRSVTRSRIAGAIGKYTDTVTASNTALTMTGTTFLDLPPEIRNYIYDLSGCLVAWQCGRCTRQWRGEDPELCYIPPADDSSRVQVYFRSPQKCCARPQTGDNTPMTCPVVGPATFWVNRSSHLIQREAEPGSKDIVKGPKHLRAKITCGVHCQRAQHAEHHTLSTAQPSLAEVCQQVRSDTLSVFYGFRVFLFTLFDTEIDGFAIEKWLQTIGPANTRMLRAVAIVCRKKKQLLYVEKTLVPIMKKLGVRVEDIVFRSVRVGYPFCFCETCVMRAASLSI